MITKDLIRYRVEKVFVIMEISRFTDRQTQLAAPAPPAR